MAEYIVLSGAFINEFSFPIWNYDFISVLEGGLAHSTTVNSSGYFNVYSGGTAHSTTVNSRGYMGVGGTVNYTTINSYGSMFVFYGGMANYTTISSDGRLYVSSGGTANRTTVNRYGSMCVSIGGTANSTTINSVGWLYVYSGGTANSTTINSGGDMVVSSGGTANSTTVSSGGDMWVCSGGTANSTTVNSGGDIWVYSGGTANSTTVNSGGSMKVSSGGTATNIIWTPCEGYVTVFDGGSATFVSQYSGVYYGSGNQLLSNVAVMDGMTVSSSGELNVMKYGIANSTTVNSRGSMYVYSGGTANSTTINSDGFMKVSSGGAATDIIENGGYVEFESGAAVTFLLNSFSGLVLSFTSATIHSGTTAYSTTVNSIGYLNVYSGGTVYSTTVNSSGYMGVGGTVYSTTVNNYGSMYVYSGGTANSTTINSGGYMWVDSGGTANSTTVNSRGSMYVSDGGTATVAFTPWQGEIIACNGASITYLERDANVYCIRDLSVSKADIMVSILLSSGCSIIIYSGGLVNSATVNRDGNLYISSGGAATNIIENGGYIRFESGAAVTFLPNSFSGLVLSSTSATIHSGTTANSTTINSVGWLYVYSGGTANSTTINSGGDMVVSSGGTANSTTVSSGGDMWVCSGGTANSTTIHSSGSLSISGGTANNTTINSGGYMWVDSGGNVTGIKENGGFVNIQDGANVTFAANAFSGLVLSFTSATIHSGTTATSTTIHSRGSMYVSSGGTANNTTINGNYFGRGVLFVSRGGTANSTTVNSRGSMYVSSGGTANSTTVISGGYCYVSSGGKLTGQTTIASDTYVSAFSGAILDFDISNLAPGAAVRINDLSLLSGWSDATFTLTVSDSQTNGTYALADGASGFDKTISVRNSSGTELDMLAVGSTTTIDGMEYTLDLSDGTLALTIEDGEDTTPPTITVYASITAPTNQDVVVSATFSDNVEVATKLYRTRRQLLPGIWSSSDWKPYDFALTITENNTTIYFKATDTSGNETEVSYAVTNIDKTPPAKPVVWANVTTETDQPVSVRASFSSDSTQQQYSFDGENWEEYTSEITFTRNGSVYFRGIDAVGNISSVTSYTVDNIVENTDITEKPSFFVGDFSGNGKSMLAVKLENTIGFYRNNEIIWSELSLDDGWEIAGVGDFDGDDLDDFLRVHSSGLVVGEMSNGYGEFSPQVLNFLGEGWQILGTGDFNGNGTDDVLVANPTGASETVGLLGYWEGGTTWTLINGYSPEWECVAVGDFNGDGKCDMLWRNSFVGEGCLIYNAYCTWIVDDPVNWRMISVANPDEWDFLCSGDFNGNGMNDIALINGEGVVGIWGVNDGYLSSWSILGAVTSEWNLAGVADFNADGTDDIAWSNAATGITGYWQINNKELTDWQNIATIG